MRWNFSSLERCALHVLLVCLNYFNLDNVNLKYMLLQNEAYKITCQPIYKTYKNKNFETHMRHIHV